MTESVVDVRSPGTTGTDVCRPRSEVGEIDGHLAANASLAAPMDQSDGLGATATRRSWWRSFFERVRRLPPLPEGSRYHGFISYSQAGDTRVATALQRGLQRFAKPWHRPHALRIFRDESSLSASPHLWTSICQALDESQYMVLLASPEAAASPWIGRETERWRETKPFERVLLCLTEGTIVWDHAARDFDWSQTTALPEQLRGAFAEEPRYVDLRWARTAEKLSLDDPRFRDAIATLAAPLHHTSKEALASEEVRQHRRTVRFTCAGVAALVALAVSAIVAGALFVGQRGTAQAERDRAHQRLAEALTQEATGEFQAGAVDRGILLGLEANRLAGSRDGRAGLVGGLEATRSLRAYLRGHAGPLHGLAFSPDGKVIASGAEDNKIILWDASTGRQIGILKGHKDWVYRVAFSPDGKTLASSSRDRTIILWNLTTGAAEQTLAAHTDTVYSVAWSPDGKTLASGSGDRTVIVWDPVKGQPIRRFGGFAAKVVRVAFSPDGKTLAAGSGDATVRLWDTGTWNGRVLGSHPTDSFGRVQGVFGLAWSPDSKSLASGSEGIENNLIVWDVASGAKHILPGHTDRVVGLAWSPDGKSLASGSGDKTIILWNPVSGARRQVLLGHTAIINALAFSPDSQTLASGGSDGAVILWNVGALDAHTGSVNALAFSPDGTTLASGGNDGVILWDLAHGRVPHRLQGSGVTNAVAFSPDGKRLATGGADAVVKLWDVATGSQVSGLRGHAQGVNALAFSADGRLLASASLDTNVIVWDAATGTRLQTLTGHDKWVDSVAFSPDGKLVAAGSDDHKIIEWDPRSGQQVHAWMAHNDAVYALAFSPNGKTLASGGGDYTIMLWNPRTGQSIANPLQGHSNQVLSIAFSPDGTTLASASKDRLVRLWNVATGQPLGGPLQGHASSVNAVAFSRDGATLASAGADQSLILWTPVPLSSDVSAITSRDCDIARRNLTKDEWRRYVPGEAYHTTCPAWK